MRGLMPMPHAASARLFSRSISCKRVVSLSCSSGMSTMRSDSREANSVMSRSVRRERKSSTRPPVMSAGPTNSSVQLSS